MAQKNTAKPSKAERTNTGKRGSQKSPMSHQALIIMGKGAHRALKPISCSSWQGTNTIHQPFDKEQSEKNKELGLWN